MTALIGALRVSLSAETAQFEAGMKRAQRTANQTRSQFQKSFSGLGGIVKAGFAGVISGLSIGLITQGIKASLEYAGSLGEVSQQLGVTTKDLQVFRFVAGQVGVSQEQLETGLSKLTITLGKVAAGAKEPAKALAAIGISVDQLKGKNTGEAFRIIADGLQKVTDRSQRAAVEVALFGKSGAMLDNILSGGASAINEYARAAEELGIVLSDEQIQNADKTADKLDKLQTVLKQRIAAEVADNANAIYDLASALSEVASVSVRAAVNFGQFVKIAAQNIGFLANPTAGIAKMMSAPAGGGGSVTVGLNTGGSALAIAKKMGLKIAGGAGGGRDIGKFLAPAGGGHKKRGGSDDAERKRLDALRDANQFDQDIRRAQMDTLRAQQDLATDYTERANIAIELLNLDRAAYQAQLQYEVQAKEITKPQADQLQAEYDKRDALERQIIRADEEARRADDYANLEQTDFDLQRDILQSQEQLAETANEQREIRLKLLDLDYRQERARLETILADEKASYAAKEEARRRLANLNKTQGNDKQAVLNSTKGPLASYMDSLPTTAEKWNEALQQVAADGLKSVEDGLVDILDGTKSVGEAFKDMARGIIRDLLRIAIRKMIIAPIANALFGGFSQGGRVGFATGGWVSGPGTATSDSIPAMLSNGEFVVNAKAAKQFMPLLSAINADRIPTMAKGGLPMARMSFGARASVSNDNQRGGSPVNINFAISGPVSRETQLQIAAATRRGIATANRKGVS